jgi:mannose-6-phosphate isomerase-like protein (cupin superfamily)
MDQSKLISAFVNHWLTEAEKDSLIRGFNNLSDWLKNGNVSYSSHTTSAFYVIYIYALEDRTYRQEVENVIDFFIKETRLSEISNSLHQLLDRLFNELILSRLEELLIGINSQASLSGSESPNDYLGSVHDSKLDTLYENRNDKLNIDFRSQKLHFTAKTLDPRIVTILVGKTNELHKHAHETIFVFLQGEGHVLIDNTTVPVKSGTFVFIPRWSMHQTINNGKEILVFLAVTDYGLTAKSFIGNYNKTARLK